jgi:hypothetical protein
LWITWATAKHASNVVLLRADVSQVWGKCGAAPCLCPPSATRVNVAFVDADADAAPGSWLLRTIAWQLLTKSPPPIDFPGPTRSAPSGLTHRFHGGTLINPPFAQGHSTGCIPVWVPLGGLWGPAGDSGDMGMQCAQDPQPRRALPIQRRASLTRLVGGS